MHVPKNPQNQLIAQIIKPILGQNELLPVVKADATAKA
jgi:hypothetical protein